MKKKLHQRENQYFFFCPGCHGLHGINKSWHIDEETVTISPSVLVTVRNNPEGPRCHSFITNGSIRFLNDCTHELRGQTVKLPEFEMYKDGSFLDPEYESF